MVISAYEKQRLENIERNKELLRQLNIPKLDVPQRTTATRSSSVKKHTPKKGPKERQAPTRVSARLRGIAASEVPDHDDLKRGRSPGGSDDPEAKKAKRIDRLDDYQQKEFMDVLKSVRNAPNTEPAPRKPQKKDVDAEEALRQHASQLQIRHTWATVKVTPDRINGCVFHPSNVKLLAIAADTTGHLGFWDVNGSKVEEEDGEEEPVVYTYRPHTRTITNLKFNPVDEQRLYTSSYDGTMQYFDMAKGAFESVSLGGEEYPITNFDWTVNGKSVWFCTSDGEVAQHDLRSRTKPKVHSIKDKKIGCVSVNPTHEHLIAVASNDRTATVWDVRAMGKEPLHEFTHGFSVTSAYWSPRGDKLATTAYDDYVRIFELADNGEISLQSAISHNTHTGRWVTNLRARWNENNVSHVANGIDHQHFVIGSMSHPVKIISGETGNEITELYDPDRITAVPAVAQFHPRTESMTILCGNGSGRMVCWS